MFKLLRRVVFLPEKQLFLGNKFPIAINCNSYRTILRMADKWPVLEKRNLPGEDGIVSKKPRIKKRMYAIFLAYCGQGYHGLQRNAGLKTIEEELLKVFLKLDIVNDEEFKRQQLVGFQRAARTDKNVSALRQCINLSMRDGVTPEEINEHLPQEIRVIAIKRVTRSFNSKNSCCARTYSYTCPSFAFAPKSLNASEDYRIDDETFEKLNRISQSFIGTHNFYHFTSGRKSFDPSCRRTMIKAEWNKPVVADGLELIMFLIKGQSFMLHQIRKMVGTLMAICRGHLSEDYITTALNPDEAIFLPTAPGIGLLLEQVHYDWYNQKFGNNGIHDSLDLSDLESVINEFRKKFIYPVLIRAEKEEKSTLEYMKTLDNHFEEYHVNSTIQASANDSVSAINSTEADTERSEPKLVTESSEISNNSTGENEQIAAEVK